MKKINIIKLKKVMSKYNNIPIGRVVQVQGIKSNKTYYTMIVVNNISFKGSKSNYDYVSIDQK